MLAKFWVLAYHLTWQWSRVTVILVTQA